MENQDEKLIRQAIELANVAKKNGNHPFGALLATKDGLSKSPNQVTKITRPSFGDLRKYG